MHCCMYRQEEEESERDTEGEETHCIVHLESFLIASEKKRSGGGLCQLGRGLASS